MSNSSQEGINREAFQQDGPAREYVFINTQEYVFINIQAEDPTFVHAVIHVTEFTPDDIEKIIKKLKDTHTRVNVKHCFEQMIRFANEEDMKQTRRAVQFGLNMGRAQELLGCIGGKDAWWCAFEPLIAESDWAGVCMLSREYFKLFRL